MRTLIWKVLEVFIASIIGYGVYFRCLIKKKPLIKTFDGKTEDVVLKLLAGGALIYFGYVAVVPTIQDIPNIIQKKVCMIEGISQSYCTPSKLNNVSADIFDEETQEMVSVSFIYDGTIEIGDKLVVQYLPNSKYGVLIERNGEVIYRMIE